MIANAALLALLFNNDGYAHILTGVNANAGANTGSGVLYLFGGTPPASADDAIELVTAPTHTKLATIKANAGANGLSFGAYASGSLPKHPSEAWSSGAMAFAGQFTSGSVLCTFARFCEGSDTGVSAGGSQPRLQLSVAQIGVGPPGDLNLTNAVLVSGATFTFSGFYLYPLVS